MGLFSKLVGFSYLSFEDPSVPLLPSSLFGNSDLDIQPLSPEQAMRFSTVFSCVRIISEDLGRLSLDIFQKMPDGSMRLAQNHKNYYLLHDRPNDNMSSQTFRMAMLANVCLYGNAYAWVKRDNAARVIALVPLNGKKTSAVLKDGKLLYGTTQTPSGSVAYIDPEDCLHFHGPTLDGITGMTPLQCHNMVSLAAASEKFSLQFYTNGTRATGIFSHPQSLDPEAYAALKQSLYESATGSTALRPIVLEEGMTYQQLTINPNDAQQLEQKKFSKEEIAQCYRIPMHLLQDLVRSNNASLEFQGTEYVRHCLMPYATQLESEIKFKILGKGPFIAEHNFQDLTRGDLATQTTAFIALRNAGIYSANDVLRGLRQNPIPTDEGGDIRIVQGAFITLDSLLIEDEPIKPETPGQEAPDTTEGDPAAYHKAQFTNSYRPLFRDAVGRSVHRGNDAAFVKKAFQPTVASMMQAVLAQRCGMAELTDKDLKVVAEIVNTIATDSATWKKEEASAIATRLTNEVFDTLTRGITNE